jgi:hypothetical protein
VLYYEMILNYVYPSISLLFVLYFSFFTLFPMAAFENWTYWFITKRVCRQMNCRGFKNCKNLVCIILILFMQISFPKPSNRLNLRWTFSYVYPRTHVFSINENNDRCSLYLRNNERALLSDMVYRPMVNIVLSRL